MNARHFLSLSEYSPETLLTLLNLARRIKSSGDSSEYRHALPQKTLAMIFEKPSTRTRLSFHVGMVQLGGQAIYVQGSDIGLGDREAIQDMARVLSGYCDAVMLRVFSHTTLLDMAKWANIPIINGLSDAEHPCQAMADFLTILEKKGRLNGLKLAYVGDGNNVCHSLIQGAAAFGLDMAVACPKGFEPKLSTTNLNVFHDPVEAVSGADIVYTDVWTSMGQESERDSRDTVFAPFQVNSALMKHAKPDAIFMHCLPAHRGQEVTDEVLESPQSVVFDQAENRLHVQKAILYTLLKEKDHE